VNRLFLVFLILSVLTADGLSQLSVKGIEELDLDSSVEWNMPRFSPDGNSVFVTTTYFNGIWQYDLKTRAVLEITSDPGSGFGFSLSPDGRKVAYRRTFLDTAARSRVQEVVVRNLTDGTMTILESGPRISTPHFIDEEVLYTADRDLRSSDEAIRTGVRVLGIERTKIALVKDGVKVLLDPLGNGSYLWPSLSPDGRSMVAFDMSRGAFVCDLAGNVQAMLGRRSAPAWTRDGKWIVFMDDRDDGHRILSSDLYALRPDGSDVTRLTDDDSVIEMYPQCSSSDNLIVFNSLEGKVYLLRYEEGSR
jgi:Tol biopolymer transport system component